MTASTTGRAGEPVWYYREEQASWYPALRFPNAWAAYSACHDVHLKNADKESPVVKDLFDQWTTFCLELAVAGKHHEPVLARLQKGPHLSLAEIDEKVSLRSFFQLMPPANPIPELQEALKHLQMFLSSTRTVEVAQSTTVHKEMTRTSSSQVVTPKASTSAATKATLTVISKEAPPVSHSTASTTATSSIKTVLSTTTSSRNPQLSSTEHPTSNDPPPAVQT